MLALVALSAPDTRRLLPPVARCRVSIASISPATSGASGPDPADPLGLGPTREELLAAIKAAPVTDADRKLVTLYSELIAPFESAVYAPGLVVDDRKDAICTLSRSLDVLEGAVHGPLLSGASLSMADAQLFPSMCLLHQTLPTHFGWEEWTEEAIFWRRPRLHAWFELIQYEPVARQAKQKVATALDALQVDWAQIAMEVPTARVRTFARHAL